MYYFFEVYYRCVVDTLVYTSELYADYGECLKAALSCQDDEHFTIVRKADDI